MLRLPARRPAALALLSGALVVVLAAPATAHAGECRFCVIFEELYLIGFGPSVESHTGFAVQAYEALRVSTAGFARVIALGNLIILVLRLTLSPRVAEDFFARVIHQVVAYVAVATLLTTGGMDLLFNMVFDLLQRTALAVAALVLQVAIDSAPTSFRGAGFSPPPPEIHPGSYSYLWYHVESVGFRVIDLATARMGEGWFGALNGSFISWVILAAPYVFVVGIFGAFLIQAQFYFIAVSITSPILVLGLVHEKTRFLATNALRLLLGGSLTIIFAAAAMAFTGAVMNHYLSGLSGLLSAADAGEQLDTAVQTRALDLCMSDTSIVSQYPDEAQRRTWCGGTTVFGQANTLRWQTQARYQVQNDPAFRTLAEAASRSGEAIITSPLYWMMFLLGFISVLLHLAAPRIASNISGANDSATSAAVVTAAGQFAAAKAMNLSSRFATAPAAAAGWAAGRLATGAPQTGARVLGGAGAILQQLAGRSGSSLPQD